MFTEQARRADQRLVAARRLLLLIAVANDGSLGAAAPPPPTISYCTVKASAQRPADAERGETMLTLADHEIDEIRLAGGGMMSVDRMPASRIDTLPGMAAAPSTAADQTAATPRRADRSVRSGRLCPRDFEWGTGAHGRVLVGGSGQADQDRRTFNCARPIRTPRCELRCPVFIDGVADDRLMDDPRANGARLQESAAKLKQRSPNDLRPPIAVSRPAERGEAPGQRDQRAVPGTLCQRARNERRFSRPRPRLRHAVAAVKVTPRWRRAS